MEHAISLEETEAPEILPFQGDYLDFVQDIVMDFNGHEIASHLIMSHRIGEEIKPQNHKFRPNILIVGKMGHFCRNYRLFPGASPSALRL